jgi:NADH-quinone oxidoreductase subunit G
VANAQTAVAPDARVHLLWGVDPALDCVWAASLLPALHSADCVIAATTFRSATLDRLAHIYLPVAPFYESGGTFINMEGRVQTAKPAAYPEGEAKPGWKVLRVAGNLWGLTDPGFETLGAVSDAAKAQIKTQIGDTDTSCPSINTNIWHCPKGGPMAMQSSVPSGACVHIAPLGTYRTDCLSREAEALQKTNASAQPIARLHPDTVKQYRLGVSDHIRITAPQTSDVYLSYTSQSDPTVPKGSLVLNAGFDHSAVLVPYDILTIERVI